MMTRLTLYCLIAMTAASIAFAGPVEERPPALGFFFTYHNPAAKSDPSAAGWLTVRGVRDGGPAQRAGLLVGDMIIEIDAKRVVLPTELDILRAFAGFKAGETIPLTVVRDGKRMRVEMIGAHMSDARYARWKANVESARAQLNRQK